MTALSAVVSVCAAALIAIAGSSHAAPRTPSSDEEVLERLAVKRDDTFRGESGRLRAAMARDPRDLESATRLAFMNIARARSESDPRRLGQAQAALAEWWNEPDPPVRILLLRAAIRQSSHEFDLALADLAKAAEREPRSAQIWLTRATVQLVTGDAEGSRSSCRHLAPLAPALVTATCLAAVEGANGNAGAALRSLDAVMRVSTAESAAVRAWATTLQAELAERLSRTEEAEVHFRRALAMDPGDAYARAAFADFLLDHGRANEVTSLIAGDTPSDPLLLRRVIAARRTQATDGDALAAKLGARFEASRARGDRVHLREEARFALEILEDASGALSLARENWKSQKEPADARIALEAAVSADNPKAVRELLEWLSRTRLEGRAIAGLASRLERR